MLDVQMKHIRKEVRDLISAHERLQGLVARGERLSDDEAGMIRLSATDLLSLIAPSVREAAQARPEGSTR